MAGKWLVGIDEAGYGPNLGPLVQAAVAVRAPIDFPSTGWWERLAPHVSKAQGGRPGCLVVDDSKEIFHSAQPEAGMKQLEEALLCLGVGPGPRFWEAIQTGMLDGAEDLENEFWLQHEDPFPSLIAADPLSDGVRNFLAQAKEVGLGPFQAAWRVIVPSRFNERTEKAGTKAAVLLDGIERFCQWVAAMAEPGVGREIVVDKLGGRDRYGPWIGQFSGGWVSVLEEGPQASAYRITEAKGDWTIRFEPKADFHHMTVALASMVAKYIREKSMDQFNAFWHRHLPDLKPTAGYPLDARRFLKEIDEVRERLGISMNQLWRTK